MVQGQGRWNTHVQLHGRSLDPLPVGRHAAGRRPLLDGKVLRPVTFSAGVAATHGVPVARKRRRVPRGPAGLSPSDGVLSINWIVADRP